VHRGGDRGGAGSFRPWAYGSSGRTVDERASVPLDGVSVVAVVSTSDNVRILEGSGAAVEVWLHGSISAGSADAIPHIQAARTGTRVDIGLAQKNPVTIGFLWSNLTLEVSVPRGFAGQVIARTSSGDIEVADHAFAGLELSTTSGSVHAGVLQAAEVSMHTSSGDLSAKGMTRHTPRCPQRAAGSVWNRSPVTSLRRAARVRSCCLCGGPFARGSGTTSGGITVRLPATRDLSWTLTAARATFPASSRSA